MPSSSVAAQSAAAGRRRLLTLLAALALATAAGADDVAAPPPAREDAMPGGIPFDVRLAEIRRRIQQALVYPALARRRALEGESEVEFGIAADGRPTAIALARSSGSTLLDRAAERAVRDAAPLPSVLGRLRVPVRFELDRLPAANAAGARP